MIPDDIKLFLIMVANDTRASEYHRMQAAILLQKYTQAVTPQVFGPHEYKESKTA